MTYWCGIDIVTRDGTPLSTDIHFPPTGPDGGPYPVVLSRTPYSRQRPTFMDMAGRLTGCGYAVAVQDVRGRHDSDGTWVPSRLGQEGADGYDTVEWLGNQSWCTGRVGTFGGSYGAWAQWALARERPPHLTAMVCLATGGAWMQEAPFDNGCVMLEMLAWLHLVSGRVVQQSQLVDWEKVYRHLPIKTMDEELGRSLPLWREWLEHPTLDDYWRAQRLDNDLPHIDIPTLHVTGWYDGDQAGPMHFYLGTAKSPSAAEQHLVIGPWNHSGTREPRQVLGGVDFGASAVVDIPELHRQWFDRWLKDPTAGRPVTPRVQIFLTGTNTWHVEDTWPPTGDEVLTYLHSGGHANGLTGDGWLSEHRPQASEPHDGYAYDPTDPVPSMLDEDIFSADRAETPLDRRFQHDRSDVLTYTSRPYPDFVCIVGQPRLRLFARTDGPDTDWFASLHDISPSGASLLLCQGRLRARFHASLEEERILEPSRIYEFAIEMGPAGHVIQPGHRLRLAVTSSDFPSWDRNPNTGRPIGCETDLRTAINHVMHDVDYASHVALPVVRSVIDGHRPGGGLGGPRVG